MTNVVLCAFLLFAAPPAAAGLKALGAGKAKVTPIEKVITLLEDLKAEVEKDGADEGAIYGKFACFCKDATKTKSDSILSGKDNINSLSAEIAEKTALQEQAEDDLKATKMKKEELEATLKQTEADCAAGLAAYKAADADVTKAISSLQGAIDTLEAAKPTAAAAAAAMITMRETIKSSIAMADAMQLIDDGPKWASAAFLQEGTGVDPSDPEYKYHSQGIIKVLTDLLATFTKKKEEADLEEKARVEACNEKIANLNSDIDLATQKIAALETEIGELASAIATARSSLVTAEATLKDDQLYLKDLTEMCEARAVDYDQRSHTRGEEIKTLTEALAVLKSDVEPRTVVNVRALLQKGTSGNSTKSQVKTQTPPSFLQEVIVSKSLRGSNNGKDAEKSKAQEDRRARALDSLRAAGNKMHSTTLLALASRAAAGPFEKVKVMIEKLIERLIHEATEEATKKGYCDTSLAKAEKDRTFRYEEVMTLNAELYALEVKEEALELEISELTDAIEELTAELTTATENREAEKAVNLETIKTAKEGDIAVTEAIMILKVYYSEAAKTSDNLGKYAQLQTKAKYSPTEDDTSGAGFEGNYGGKQDSMKAIMGLLEVIKSDFDRTVRKTTEAEAEAHAAFVLYERATKADIASKTTKKELDEEDLDTTKTTIATKMEEMQNNMNLVDEANKELETLKPMCIDTGMSYAERVAKREEEIEHLKTALCILDESKVEPECSR